MTRRVGYELKNFDPNLIGFRSDQVKKNNKIM
jgi:hypothetical protein